MVDSCAWLNGLVRAVEAKRAPLSRPDIDGFTGSSSRYGRLDTNGTLSCSWLTSWRVCSGRSSNTIRPCRSVRLLSEKRAGSSLLGWLRNFSIRSEML